MVKLSPDDIDQSLALLEEKWADYFPKASFDYTFLDTRFEQLYAGENRFKQVFAVFSIFAILVATLGLFGLASFLATQRMKEIGIRKVLGASTGTIISFFVKDFVNLIMIAGLIGIPIVYFGMDFWLDNYAYRIRFPWQVIPISVVILTLVSALTVSLQTFRVAVLNPAITLKNE